MSEPTNGDLAERTTIRDTPRRHYPSERREPCRAERRRTGLEHIDRQRATWFLSDANLRTAIRDMLVGVWIPTMASDVVRWVLEKPWKYRIEFVIGRCRELDGPEPC